MDVPDDPVRRWNPVPHAHAGVFVRKMRSLFRMYEPVVLGIAGVAIVFIIWEGVSRFAGINHLLFPAPGATAHELTLMLGSAEFYPHLFASLRLLTTAYLTAIGLGTLIGFAAGWFPTLRAILLPHLTLLYSTPSIGLMPLFIVLLGLGFVSQFAVVLLLAFFPAYYAAVDAVRTADRSALTMARSFTASDVKIFRTVVLPGSIPLLISGFRIALGKAIVGVLLVELYSSALGLGYLLNLSGIQFNTARVFAIIILIAMFGLAASIGLRAMEQRFDHWRTDVELGN